MLLIYGITASGFIGLLILLLISGIKNIDIRIGHELINDCILITAGSGIRNPLAMLGVSPYRNLS
jgi:hypothetical protein